MEVTPSPPWGPELDDAAAWLAAHLSLVAPKLPATPSSQETESRHSADPPLSPGLAQGKACRPPHLFISHPLEFRAQRPE